MPQKPWEPLQFRATRTRRFDDLVIDGAVHFLGEICGVGKWKRICRAKGISSFVHIVRIIFRVRNHYPSGFLLGENKINYLLNHSLTHALVDQISGGAFVKLLLGALVYLCPSSRLLCRFFIGSLQLAPSTVRKNELWVICLPR
ncbi:hypothetical protein X748_30630 [Mesorhizobium sp. LNJC386A00]|nr:hypothetical protein X748_30630 [Mesorhizobium sp. LNJC386A00]